MSAPPPDVQEFAALLTRLKERTDRSYGQLARRLHMNTSTLHRYCAGETVPVDFAPVERFAALCHATAEERLELHRMWLAALEARRRPRTADAPGGGAGEAGSPGEDSGEPGEDLGELGEDSGKSGDSGQTGEPGGGDAVPVVGAGTPSVSMDRPDSSAGAGADPGSGFGSGSGSGAGVGPAPGGGAGPARGPDQVPGAGTGAGAASGDDPSANSSPADPPAPRRPWDRRRRVVASAAVVSVLLVTLGSLAALPEDRTSGDRRATGTPTPSGPETALTGDRPSSASASPSASKDRPSKKPSPTASGTTSRPAPGGGAGKPAGGTPLTWTVNPQMWEHGCAQDYVITKPPAQVPPPPAPQDAVPWAATQGAVHGRQTLVQISVQGRSSTAVVLTALRVRVVGRTTPVQGNAYSMDQGCGGQITPRSFQVDLDKDRPLARPLDGGDVGTTIPAIRMPYRVSAEEPEVLLVDAETQTCDCRWYLELDWSSQGRTGTVRIDDRGRPFRTTAVKGLPRYTYATWNRAWEPQGG